MKKVVLNVNGLAVPDQLVKGADIITKSTNNVNVPGNATEVAAFVIAQDDLDAKNAALVAARTDVKTKAAELAASGRVWKAKLKVLADKTEAVTEGDEAGILSAGFGVKSDPSPPQPLEAPLLLHAKTNGTPGVTKLSWEPVDGAASYLVETCADPMTPDGWEQIDSPTKASCTVEGAEPGKARWYRVAGVNPLGQGPWSDPASRPVM